MIKNFLKEYLEKKEKIIPFLMNLVAYLPVFFVGAFFAYVALDTFLN